MIFEDMCTRLLACELERSLRKRNYIVIITIFIPGLHIAGRDLNLGQSILPVLVTLKKRRNKLINNSLP